MSEPNINWEQVSHIVYKGGARLEYIPETGEYLVNGQYFDRWYYANEYALCFHFENLYKCRRLANWLNDWLNLVGQCAENGYFAT